STKPPAGLSRISSRCAIRHHPSMIVDNLHLVGVSLLEPEDDPPGTVHPDRPETRAVAAQLMQTDAAQGRERLQGGRRIQLRQTLPGKALVQSTEPGPALLHK